MSEQNENTHAHTRARKTPGVNYFNGISVHAHVGVRVRCVHAAKRARFIRRWIVITLFYICVQYFRGARTRRRSARPGTRNALQCRNGNNNINNDNRKIIFYIFFLFFFCLFAALRILIFVRSFVDLDSTMSAGSCSPQKCFRSMHFEHFVVSLLDVFCVPKMYFRVCVCVFALARLQRNQHSPLGFVVLSCSLSFSFIHLAHNNNPSSTGLIHWLLSFFSNI